jgi:HAE1 family hydrophobic/amphiphilic exporter-1
MSRFFIARPVLANVLAIVIVLLGVVSYLRLPVSEYPNVVPPTISVTARYPGASAQTVIDTIALPIEQQVNGVDGMIYMQSTSAYDGTYSLIVTFEIGTDPNIAQVLVQNRVQLAMAQLPQAVQAQGVNVQKKSTSVLLFVTLDSPQDKFDGLYLSNYATINLTSELARVPGVGNVLVIGSGSYAMRVWMDPEKLYSFGLEPSDVIRAIRQQSQNVAAGQVGTPPAPQETAFQYTIEVQSRLNEPEQFGSIVVKDQTAQGGRLVYLRDVARIELGAQTYSQSFRLNGRPAAGIAIYQTPEANALAVGQAVAAKMEELAKRFPEGLRFSIPYDTTLFVKASIAEVYTTLYQAGVLVLVVILVFLQNFRATLIPAQTIPVTIIGAFLAMDMLGFTVNLSTLFGIVLAIGIVVDDAIVIVEGVTKEIENGNTPPVAAGKAMDALYGPILGITLVLMSVFLPTAFVPGLSGQMFAQFALVIAATALISAINAVTLKPTQSAQWLRMPVPPEKRFIGYRWFNRVYDACERGYARMIGWMVQRALAFVLVGLVVAGAAVWGLARLPTGFLPIDDQGYALVAIELPEGAALGRAQAVADEATKIALGIPGVERVIGISGMSLLDNSADLSNSAALYVVFRSFEERKKAAGQDLVTIARTLQERLGVLQDGRATVLPPPPIQGIGNAGGFQMQLEMLGGSFNYAKLNDLAGEMVKQAAADPRIGRALSTFRLNAPHVVMTVDRERAETLRVSVGDVFAALTDYVGSTYVNQFNKFGLSLQVYVQADSQFRLNPDDLLKLHVRSSDGQMVPLGALASLGQSVGPALVTLYNQYPSATIIGAPGRGFSDGQAIAAMEEIARRVLPADVSFQWTAMSYQEKITGNQLYYVFALSLLLVYLCLAGQYESWILPLAVLSAVPLALVGPAAALGALGVPNNLYVQIGLVLLIALAAKNGILIVEVAREQYQAGRSAMEAAVEASRERFRPILMTSFAFILGVLPLVLATGAGANARKSLGIAVFSGMIASTCLAVVFVPSFFVVLQRLDARMRGKGKTAETAEAAAQASR